MSTKPPGPPPPRFRSHMDHAFCEHMRGRLHKRLAEFPTHVYHPRQAEVQLEEAARQVIVEVLIEEFPEAWSVPRVTPDWPKAMCLINAERSSARIVVSWSPETDALQGGTPVDAIDFPVKQAPPSLGRRMINKILDAIPGKRVGDPEMAPIGKPEEPKRATAQKPIQKQRPEPPKPGKPRPR